jgi:anti-sigma factor RsiW
MNDPLYQILLERSWRRELTPQEKAQLRAFLATHPEAAVDWQAEATLTGALRHLPNPPAPSNFTAQVMRAVELERTRHRPSMSWWEQWGRVFWPKAAWAAAAVLIGAVGFQQYRHFDRLRLARDLARIPVVAALPAPDTLQDFDAIRQFSRVSTAPGASPAVTDDELLAALQ